MYPAMTDPRAVSAMRAHRNQMGARERMEIRDRDADTLQTLRQILTCLAIMASTRRRRPPRHARRTVQGAA